MTLAWPRFIYTRSFRLSLFFTKPISSLFRIDLLILPLFNLCCLVNQLSKKKTLIRYGISLLKFYLKLIKTQKPKQPIFRSIQILRFQNKTKIPKIQFKIFKTKFLIFQWQQLSKKDRFFYILVLKWFKEPVTRSYNRNKSD